MIKIHLKLLFIQAAKGTNVQQKNLQENITKLLENILKYKRI